MMDSRKKKVLTVLCLGCVLLAWRGYVLITGYVLPTKTSADMAGAVPQSALPPAGLPVQVATGLAASVLQQQEAIAQQPWGRDPFAVVPESRTRRAVRNEPAERQEVKQAPPAPALRLTGVSRSDGRWLAVVDNKIVRIGDRLGGDFAVVEIDKRSLTIAAGEWAFRYELGVDQPVTRAIGEEP